MAECQSLMLSGKTRNMKLNGIKLTWLGHATFRIETPEGKIVIVDPWVMGNPMCPEKEKDDQRKSMCCYAPTVTLTILAMRSKSRRSTIPMVVAIPELGHWLEKKGVKQVSNMNKGGTQNSRRHQGDHGARRSLLRHHGRR